MEAAITSHCSILHSTYGDYYATTTGFLLTLLGTILAALKTIYTNVLQSSSHKTPRVHTRSPLTDLLVPPSLNMHPLDLLTRMSPLALVQCIVYAYFSGEFAQIYNSGAVWSPTYLLVLLGNGVIAFGLNVVSFTANGKVGALNMAVAGACSYDTASLVYAMLMTTVYVVANVKQVLTILLAMAVFNLSVSRTNALGIAITIAGGAWYAWVEYEEKARRQRTVDVHGQVSSVR